MAVLHTGLLVGLLAGLLLLASGAAVAWLAEGPAPGEPPTFPALERQAGSANPAQPLEPWSYLPVVATAQQPLPWIDTQNRAAAKAFYLTEYLASEGATSGWTGNHAGCNPGTTAEAFREAILKRINYFRAMSGVPPLLGFKAEYNQKAQAAALMMSVNDQLDHTPPSSWTCYSADGYEGASSSNLYLGVYGPTAISGYIYDPGGGNYPVGHRRWILYPQTRYMGTGDVPPRDGYRPSNALWVFDRDSMWGPRPATREPYVAWPPPGYTPRQVVYPRWSFSYPGADFSAATVVVRRDGQPVGLTVSPVVNGYGENTLVWELDEALPAGEVVYTVTVQQVGVGGGKQTFSYEVRVFDATE